MRYSGAGSLIYEPESVRGISFRRSEHRPQVRAARRRCAGERGRAWRDRTPRSFAASTARSARPGSVGPPGPGADVPIVETRSPARLLVRRSSCPRRCSAWRARDASSACLTASQAARTAGRCPCDGSVGRTRRLVTPEGCWSRVAGASSREGRPAVRFGSPSRETRRKRPVATVGPLLRRQAPRPRHPRRPP